MSYNSKYKSSRIEELLDVANDYEGKLFVGTQSEYDTLYAEGKIQTGALVIILEDWEYEYSSESALLGTAVIGKMVLGKS